MCAVKKAVEAHLFWSIGSGQMCFWHENWLGDKPLSDLLTVDVSQHHVQVAFFLRDGRWNEELLRLTLPGHLVDRILQIPLEGCSGDRLRWKPEANGQFSFKSAWELVRKPGVQQQLLSAIWLQAIAPSVSIFCWRLLNNYLPVESRLRQKGLQLASWCGCCQQEETVSHLFLTNDHVIEVWNYFAAWFNISNCNTDCVQLRLQQWRFSAPATTKGHIRTLVPILILWHIWTLRNDSRHKKDRFCAAAIIRRVLRHLKALYQTHLLKYAHWKGESALAARLQFYFVNLPLPKPVMVRWLFPERGWVKLNCDGAAKGNPGLAGCGGVLRGFDGQAIFAYSVFLGEQTNTRAELEALLAGLTRARPWGFRKIWIELDSQAVIQLVQANRAGCWQTQHILSQIQTLLRHTEYHISHIYREGNKVADHLANVACEKQESEDWLSNNIRGITASLINMDRKGYPNFRFR